MSAMFYPQQAALAQGGPRLTNQGSAGAGVRGPRFVGQRHLLDPAAIPPGRPMGSAGALQGRPGLRRSKPYTRGQPCTPSQQSRANILADCHGLGCDGGTDSSPGSPHAPFEADVSAHGAAQASREEGPIASWEEQNQQWHARDTKVDDIEREILTLEVQMVFLMSKQAETSRGDGAGSTASTRFSP